MYVVVALADAAISSAGFVLLLSISILLVDLCLYSKTGSTFVLFQFLLSSVYFICSLI